MIEFDRNQGIGGSDVPVIVGMSPYRSAIDLWDEKRGDALEREQSFRMRVGQVLEAGIATLYAEHPDGGRVWQPTVPFGVRRRSLVDYDAIEPDPLIAEKFGYPTWAQIDRVRYGKPRRGVEIKHTANLSRFSGEDVPDDVAVQVQHAMMLTGWQSFDVVTFSGGRDLKITTIDADRDVHEAIAEACREFWRRVREGEPPPPDGSDAAGRWIRQRYNAVEPGKIVVATHDVLPLIAERLRLAAEKKGVEQELERVNQELQLFMGDAEQLDAPGDVKITWREQGGRRDWKAIAADLRRLIEANSGSIDFSKIEGMPDERTVEGWLDFIESMHTGEPTRVFRVTGKAVAL
jgi:predicted phage-related endonuclease